MFSVTGFVQQAATRAAAATHHLLLPLSAAPTRAKALLHTSPISQLFSVNEDGSNDTSSFIVRAMQRETKRQLDELVLIPSESICLPECEALMSSPFGNIYAEGQPSLRLNKFSPALAVDEQYFQAWFRRLSDGRYYRGCIEADQVELLAKYYLSVAFSRLEGSPPAHRIYANFQALSGGPANLAIYNALLNYGDRLLTMDLTNGGHLSHGSPFNVSGKLYAVSQYSVDNTTRLLDYDAIHRQAQEVKPQMIVGGASAYPWDFDWKALREIADDVGALLHADVCHIAGMIFGGLLANPLPYADTVMFTTHKTMMGPRGAVIASKDPAIAQKIDNAVFPGLQGGPHMNNIAGIARLFEIIVTKQDEYSALQKKLANNALVFANALKKEGFSLEYQGTNNHMVLIDLKKFECTRGGHLDGETASRLLENIGIIVNKNTLPGDVNAGDSSGIRVATPWLTQRGVTTEQLKDLASIMREYLASANAFHVWAPAGDERCRARIPYKQLLKSRDDVLAISSALPYPKISKEGLDTFSLLLRPLNCIDKAVNVKCCKGLLIRGEKARIALNQALTCDVMSLAEGEIGCGFVLTPAGEVISGVAVTNLGTRRSSTAYEYGNDMESLVVFVPEAVAQATRDWLLALSDGYVELDEQDPYQKVDGPFVVAPAESTDIPEEILRRVCDTTFPVTLADATAETVCIDKPFFIGQSAMKDKFTTGDALPSFSYQPPENPELKQTLLHSWHEQNGGAMVNFGGWNMPVKYGSIADEHRAVRTSAALFDVSHMSCVGVSGPNATLFMELLLANTAARLMKNEAQYTYMLREDGTALDDAYAYRLAQDKYMIVFNAGNFERDWAWINQVNNGEVCVDLEQPSKRIPQVELTNLRDAGEDSLLDIAFQGPRSLEILSKMVPDQQKDILARGKMNDIHFLTVNGIEVMAARTGYTGENVGFELFVHPDVVVPLWKSILEVGKSDGVVAAGLGARDSARIEAGFPLFGHELEGPASLSLTEADYGYVSRFHRTFYIGRKPYIERTNPRNQRLLRLKGHGRRSVREGHTVIDADGAPVGTITSFAFTDDDYNFYAIAAVDASFTPKLGSTISVARMARDKVKGKVASSKIVELIVKPRFPTDEEKAQWRTTYSA